MSENEPQGFKPEPTAELLVLAKDHLDTTLKADEAYAGKDAERAEALQKATDALKAGLDDGVKGRFGKYGITKADANEIIDKIYAQQQEHGKAWDGKLEGEGAGMVERVDVATRVKERAALIMNGQNSVIFEKALEAGVAIGDKGVESEFYNFADKLRSTMGAKAYDQKLEQMADHSEAMADAAKQYVENTKAFSSSHTPEMNQIADGLAARIKEVVLEEARLAKITEKNVKDSDAPKVSDEERKSLDGKYEGIRKDYDNAVKVTFKNGTDKGQEKREDAFKYAMNQALDDLSKTKADGVALDDKAYAEALTGDAGKKAKSSLGDAGKALGNSRTKTYAGIDVESGKVGGSGFGGFASSIGGKGNDTLAYSVAGAAGIAAVANAMGAFSPKDEETGKKKTGFLRVAGTALLAVAAIGLAAHTHQKASGAVSWVERATQRAGNLNFGAARA